MRDNSEAVRVIGNFNSESKFIDARTGRETSVLLTAGRGYFVVGLVGVGQEPTDHALKDIAAKAAELEQWAVRSSCSSPMKRHTRNTRRHPPHRFRKPSRSASTATAPSADRSSTRCICRGTFRFRSF